MSGPRVGVSARAGLAAVALGVGAASSYVGQRLWAARAEDFDPELIFASEHIPFRWRCAMALVHGVVLAGLLGGGATEEQAGRALRAFSMWGPLWIALLAATMVGVP